VRQKGFALLPVIIIIALIGIVGYLVYQNTQLKNGSVNPSPTITNTVTNLPERSPSPEPTANWKTYTNNKYGYSIKVPAYISQLAVGPGNAKVIDDADWLFAKTDLSLLDSAHKSIASGGAVVLEIASYPSNVAQQNYDMHCKGTQLSFNQENPTISDTSPITDVEQYTQSYGIASHSTVPQIKFWDSKVCFIKNGIDYEIYYQNYESSNTDPTFDQILSTLKFTQ
jgi:hypothetical protein